VTVTALKRMGRLLFLVGIIGGTIAAVLHRDMFSPTEIATLLRHDRAAPIVFVALQVIASLVFIPRAFLAVAAGLVFGFWGGLLWASAGSLTGAVAGFLIVRYVKEDLVDLDALPLVRPILAKTEAAGWRGIVVLRLIPLIPHTAINYALGLTRLPLGAYALGSFIGQLPTTIVYIDLGDAGKRLMEGRAGWLLPLSLSLAVLVAVTFGPRLVRRWRMASAYPRVAVAAMRPSWRLLSDRNYVNRQTLFTAMMVATAIMLIATGCVVFAMRMGPSLAMLRSQKSIVTASLHRSTTARRPSIRSIKDLGSDKLRSF
jgi:uncharacterized membrane protein YdjX (TVP38/TMEM64 family)